MRDLQVALAISLTGRGSLSVVFCLKQWIFISSAFNNGCRLLSGSKSRLESRMLVVAAGFCKTSQLFHLISLHGCIQPP